MKVDKGKPVGGKKRAQEVSQRLALVDVMLGNEEDAIVRNARVQPDPKNRNNK